MKIEKDDITMAENIIAALLTRHLKKKIRKQEEEIERLQKIIIQYKKPSLLDCLSRLALDILDIFKYRR